MRRPPVMALDEALLTPGELLVGVDEAPPAPLNFGTPGGPAFRGFEVDLVDAIAGRLGLRAAYRSAPWSVILGDLAARRLDAVCGAATVTAERRRAVDFSDPYLDVHLVLVVRAGTPATRVEALAGRPVGARAGTEAERYVRRHAPGTPVRLFDLNTDQYDALQAGEVQAVVDDSPIAGHFARTRGGLRVAARLPGTDAQYAIAFAKGNTALRDAVNGALAALRADGTLERLRRTWLGSASG